MSPKKCLVCIARMFFIFGAFIGVSPFIVKCRCNKQNTEIKINWTFVCLILGFAVIRLLIATHDAYRLLNDTKHFDFEFCFLLVLDMFIELDATLSCVALKNVYGFKVIVENNLDLVDYFKQISYWSTIEDQIMNGFSWKIKYCWLPSVINGSMIFVLSMISRQQFIMAIMIATSTFLISQFLITIAVVIQINIIMVKCCYTEIMKCVTLASNNSEPVLSLNTQERLHKLVDFQKLVLENFELLNKSSGGLLLMYYIQLMIAGISLTAIWILQLIQDTDIRPSLFMGLPLITMIIMMNAIAISTATSIMSVDNELRSFLFRYPISRLEKNEALMVETILQALNHRKFALRFAGTITLGVKLLAESLQNILTYLLVAVQFYLSATKSTNK